MTQKEKKINRCKFAFIKIDNTTSCVVDGWEDDKVTKTDEARCEACEKYKSKYIEYPITVDYIDVKPIKYDSWHCKTGDLVAVRPCDEKYGKKTYLGYYLGELPKTIWPTFNSKDGVLSIGTTGNPAMFVPELGEIIWGCGSWWHKVKSEKELHDITDKDINDTWYVKLARQLQEKEGNLDDEFHCNAPTQEDEKIRKALISILKSDFEKDTTIFGISVGQIIDWLEKQVGKSTVDAIIEEKVD